MLGFAVDMANFKATNNYIDIIILAKMFLQSSLQMKIVDLSVEQKRALRLIFVALLILLNRKINVNKS